MIDADEAKLRQLESLIAETKEAERLEAARKADEERQRAEREVARGSYTLADLEAAAAKLREEIALRQHHLRADAEQDVLRRRAERLSAEIQITETKLADMRAEFMTVMGTLPN
jgi:chromosome segregation ATPase